MGGKSSKSSKSSKCTTKEVAKKVVTPFKIGDAVKSIYVSFSEICQSPFDMFYSLFLLLCLFSRFPPPSNHLTSNL